MGIDIEDFKSPKGIMTMAAGVFLLVSGILAASATGSAFYSAGYANSFGDISGYMTLKESCTEKPTLDGASDFKCTPYTRETSCGTDDVFADTTACKFYKGCRTNIAMLGVASAFFFVAAIIAIVSIMFFERIRYIAVGLTVIAAVLTIVGLAVYKGNEDDMVGILFGWADYEGFYSKVGSGYNCEITAIIFSLIGEILLVIPQFMF